MNNKKYRPRLSQIEIKMIISDMINADYKYFGKTMDSHTEIINRLTTLVKG